MLSWITLRPGDRLSGLVVTIAEGAASLGGQVTVENGASIPQRLYVYLVPAEREKALDPLRYLAAPVAADRTMSLSNIPPGRYLLFCNLRSTRFDHHSQSFGYLMKQKRPQGYVAMLKPQRSRSSLSLVRM